VRNFSLRNYSGPKRCQLFVNVAHNCTQIGFQSHQMDYSRVENNLIGFQPLLETNLGEIWTVFTGLSGSPKMEMLGALSFLVMEIWILIEIYPFTSQSSSLRLLQR
jgi:hypothetical protein